ncbi:MAG: hypothetical protein ACREEM_05760 [Blastocatellia bacterium]
MKRNIILLVSLLVASLTHFQSPLLLRAWASADERAPKRQRASDRVTVQAAGRGNPWINLSDGRDVNTAYAGATGTDQFFERNQARPLSLASADFDEDGVADLISGHAHAGGGLLTLHRSNVDSIFPRNPGARQRRDQAITSDDSQAPFLSPARVFEMAEAPQLIGAGDFNNDGHRDVVAAAMGSDALHLLAGDGRGGLGQTERIGLPGRVTALVTGEINRADGSVDIVVGIIGAEGPRVLVFESPEGALRGAPEVFALPAEAKALALSQFDGDSLGDLAVAAGHDLVIVHGRDRKLLLEESKQAQVPQPTISQRSLPFTVRLMATGDFTGDHMAELALLSDDGAIHLLGKRGQKDEGIEGWNVETLATNRWPLAAGLVCAGVSSDPKDDLVVVDRASGQLHILTSDPPTGSSDTEVIAASPPLRVSASLDVEDGAVAAMPMRLNDDAQSDLVILRSGQIAPAVIFTVAAATYTVTNTNDSGSGSLRQAITDANNNPGADRIEFRIGSGEKTINLLSELPIITFAGGPVMIDGSTQPSGTSGLGCLEQKGRPCIELNGSNAVPVSDGLVILAGSSVVRGLAINRFKGDGIILALRGGNLIIGNHIGVDITGAVALGNERRGVGISTPNNFIGFGGLGNGNVISGNGFGAAASPHPGVEIQSDAGNSATGTIIQGNFIGVNSSGTAALPNAFDGVFVNGGSNSTIGGTETTTRNIISGNKGHGIRILRIPGGASGAGNRVLGNYIGVKANGSDPLGNSGDGVRIDIAQNNTIGGTTGTSSGSCSGACNVISSNGRGVAITGSGATGNQMLGNYIGTNSLGTVARGNTSPGVLIGDGSSNNTIGGTTPEARNIISGNGLSGVSLAGNGNQILGNYIGTNAAGNASLSNFISGVLAGGTNNTLGGTTAGARNVISGNSSSNVSIYSSDPSNRVQGNYIGLDSSGTFALANPDLGVLIEGDSNFIIGGTEAGAGNVISGHVVGVLISGTGGGGMGNKIQGNFIGANATGAARVPNFTGVQIQNASDNIVGGTVAGARNVISGNTIGVTIINDPRASGNNKVQGNFIGTDRLGDSRLGNGVGVNIVASDGNIVGGTTTEARNVISGNATGVRISDLGTNNQVLGNFIGVDAGGSVGTFVNDLGNTLNGVTITDAPSNIIGGATAGARNIISGNKQHGVLIAGANSTENKVQGNYIGLNATGAAKLGNAINGVHIENGASGATIGGATAGARNVISGNGVNGVAISGADATGNRVQGNLIGTDVNGAIDLGNNSNGVSIDNARGNIIGGTTNLERNVISGNNAMGIAIQGSGATMNQSLGNFIGVNAAGTADLGNTSDGVFINGASGNTIGGTAAGARNVISGNDGHGISLRGNGNLVQGNFIGADITGAAALGNLIFGVSILNASNNTIGNTIGGTAANAGNTIAFNGAGGVVLTMPGSVPVTGNAILSNSIFSNTGPVLPDMGLGIDLGADGVTPNDSGDADPGPNNLQNFPALTSIITGSGNTTIQGTLNSAANTAFRLEFFSNAACDPSGNGEGQNFIGSTMVTTNASGAASFNVTFQIAVVAGRFFTATATDSNNNTSEFCQCRLAINSVVSVSAASFSGTALASESIVAAFGLGLATAAQSADTLPLPTSLAGTRVSVRDGAGNERLAPLFFVSSTQVNYQMPPGTATGLATITGASGNGTVSVGQAQIVAVAPGLFAANANGQGVAAAVALRVKADGAQSFEPVVRFDAGQNKFVAAPLDLGPEADQVFLVLFGTGIRFRSSLAAVTATIGGAAAPVLFADAQGGFVGLDQVNARIPRSLIGRGEVDLVLTADAKTANTIKVNIK